MCCENQLKLIMCRNAGEMFIGVRMIKRNIYWEGVM